MRDPTNEESFREVMRANGKDLARLAVYTLIALAIEGLILWLRQIA